MKEKTMSKICTREYTTASLQTVEVIDSVFSCPLCKNPADCHGATVDQRLIFWLLSKDTGISSKAIARHITGIKGTYWTMLPPSDAADRRRCIKLLELIPEWINKLPEMVQYDQQPQEGITINSSGVSAYTNSWAKQIPLIRQEGKL